MTTEYSQRTLKKTDDNICASCKKPFLPGHRIHAAYICLDPHAFNPQKVTERGLELGVDCEFVHCRCSDPFLDGRRIELT